MSNPPTPSTNGYGEVIGNGHQTVNLASAVLELVHQPLSSFWASRNAIAALRTGLGEWAEEAFDANNRCQQPVLREDAFVAHLIDNSAAFRPSGSCSATFAWAKLLYALDIRPGNNIIEWRPLGTDADPKKSGTVELALEGPVLCHIVNLYQLYDSPYGARLKGLHKYGVTWQFPFGALTMQPKHNSSEGNSAVAMTSDPRSWTATFKPHSNNELSAPRQPFVTNFIHWLKWSGGPLPFEPNSIAIKYISTVKHSMCSDGALRLPDPKDAIQTRCRSVCKCFATLLAPLDTQFFPSCIYWNGPDYKPYLVTPSWIKQASRIKRRMTTNGGIDNGLAEHVVRFISRKPTAVKIITDSIHSQDDSEDETQDETWKDNVLEAMKRLLFYGNDTFQFVWAEPASYSMGLVPYTIMNELPHALNALGLGSAKTWLSPLGEMVPEAVQILNLETFENYPVLVLQLTSDHPLWRSTCYIQGQVPTR
ncbi:hypothetical protein F5Y09DRAFT_249871 [Xylaria sp. FL1042]|nr:hypothetical protein F5Y09DRAFT_249871 [Xylaria sp. FL1042]